MVARVFDHRSRSMSIAVVDNRREGANRLRNQYHVPAGHVKYINVWWFLLTPEFRYVENILKVIRRTLKHYKAGSGLYISGAKPLAGAMELGTSVPRPFIVG